MDVMIHKEAGRAPNRNAWRDGSNHFPLDVFQVPGGW